MLHSHPPLDLNKDYKCATSTFLLVYNWAVWKCRQLVREGLKANRNALLKKCYGYIGQFCNRWDPKALSRAASRKNRQARLASSLIEEATKKYPILIYTDGSALGNPGHAGAGCVIYKNGSILAQLTKPLGESTNNVGEFWAIGMALQYMADHNATERVAIFTDCSLVTGVVNRGWSLKKNVLLMRALKKALRLAPFSTHMYWVPGHAKLKGNEIADHLAKSAALLSSSSRLETVYVDPAPAPVLFDYLIQ